MSSSTKAKSDKPESQGGLAFFSSLFFLLVLSISNLTALVDIWSEPSQERMATFGIGTLLGWWFASHFINGKWSVLIHEYKHAILALFVGNKWKGINVKRDSGHFRYSYTKKTASYNAFIALAPYFLPLFTLPALLIGIPFAGEGQRTLLILAGSGYGADCFLNFRDVSPHQTDLTTITGGYRIGTLYILAINLAICTILLAWVFGGLSGVTALFERLWFIVLHLVSYYRGRTIEV